MNSLSHSSNLFSYRSACAIGMISLCIRAFGAAFIDSPELANAGWLGVLLGGALYFPTLSGIWFLSRIDESALPENLMQHCIGKAPMRCLSFLLSLSMLYESACTARILMASMLYGTQEIAIGFGGMLPPLLAAGSVICAGACALGGTGTIWLYFAPVLLLIIIGVHAPVYRFEYLFPMPGVQASVLLGGSLKVLRAFSAFSVLWLTQSGEHLTVSRQKHRCSPALFPILFCVIVLFTCLLTLFANMLAPQAFSFPQSREYRLSMLLSNGLSPTFLQFPYVLLWYGSLLVSLGFSLFAAVRLMHMTFPHLPWRISVWGAAALSAALGALHAVEPDIESALSPYLAGVNSLPFILAAIAGKMRKGGKACASSK